MHLNKYLVPAIPHQAAMIRVLHHTALVPMLVQPVQMSSYADPDIWKLHLEVQSKLEGLSLTSHLYAMDL